MKKFILSIVERYFSIMPPYFKIKIECCFASLEGYGVALKKAIAFDCSLEIYYRGKSAKKIFLIIYHLFITNIFCQPITPKVLVKVAQSYRILACYNFGSYNKLGN